MEDRSKQARERKVSELDSFESELNRMDYEGGNQGDEGSNKRKNEKEDTEKFAPTKRPKNSNKP